MSGNGNQINITLGSHNTSPEERQHDETAGSSSSSGPPAAAPAAAGGGGRGQRAARPARYYVVAFCPRDPSLVGVWHCRWNELCCKLPGGQLFGSTARPTKAFDSWEAAVEEWGRYHTELLPTLRVP